MTADVDISWLLGIAFSDQQLRAITAPLEPAVVVAGAGSGKTTVMAARVVWLVATGQIRPEQVLGLTFTNKAATELAARVRAALASLNSGRHPYGLAPSPSELGEPTISTYHAFAGRLVTEHALRLGIEPDLRLLADASRFQLATETVRAASGPYPHLSTHVPTLVTDVLALDEQMSEHLVEAADLRAFHDRLRSQLPSPAPTKRLVQVRTTTEKRDELLCLVEAYRRRKSEGGVVDFADQMALGARIGELCPAAGAAEREHFRVVLLDEYQDTSIAQRRMLSGLFSGAEAASGRGHPVMAVGDPCQAIYGWRGASVANLEDFPDHFPTAAGEPARRYALSVNRRSGAVILDAANAHAAPLYAVHTGVEPLRCPPSAASSGVQVALHETYADEITWVAGEVARVHAETPGLRWCDIGILTHDNADAAALRGGLDARGIPVEVVGLGGLLATPEVTEVVAVLEVLHDVNANAALLRVLTGPRWRIGPRDLALLGRRARSLADRPGRGSTNGSAGLQHAVTGTDPVEMACLTDAVESPGGLAYSEQARERFAQLSAELRALRGWVHEPLVDLVRRVVTSIGLDIELGLAAAHSSRSGDDNLDAFVEAVQSFAGTGNDASLGGLLAYLAAEDDYADGLAVASPSETDSVKLLTVHKAKGLEWDVVFLPMLAEGVFPSGRGRARWVSAAKELPGPLRGDAATLPSVPAWSGPGLDAFQAQARECELREERRLGYVALTRARRLLVASGHWWGPTQTRPRGPSDYLRQLAAGLPGGSRALACWVDAPAAGSNPALDQTREFAWPVPPDPSAAQDLAAAAELVERARADTVALAAHRSVAGSPVDASLTPAERSLVNQWDLELAQLVDGLHRDGDGVTEVPLPTALSTTRLLQLRSGPQHLAADLARPMPRQPSPAARIGSRFHTWVETHAGQQRLLEVDEIPGAADVGIAGDAELRMLTDAFRAGPYGDRRAHRVEAPFSLVLAGQVVRGRIDAVYRTEGGWEVLDWKTSHRTSADPLQLAVYRLAWAELAGVPLESVAAAFYYVRTGVVDRPAHLPGRLELEGMLAGV